MSKEETLAGLILELRRGTVVLSALSQLATPMYGYELVSLLSKSNIPVEANTLYPLLRRLEGQNILCSSWNTDGAKPRKYYQRTETGHKIYEELKAQWNAIAASMAVLLEEKA